MKKSGFTLLEIIIVLVILGVMTTLALPRFFSMVEGMRNAESDTNVRIVADSIGRCRLSKGNVTATCPNSDLDVTLPNLTPLGHFTYKIDFSVTDDDPDCGDVDFCVIATRNSRNGGDNTRQRVLVSGRNGCRIIRDEEQGRCFVATAVYGSEDAKQVLILRKFRDEVLLPNPFGKSFVHYYYRHGPQWAKEVKKSELLTRVIRKVLDGVVQIIDHP